MGKHFKIIVSGKVQGVCFRAKTQHQALKSHFLGQVRNLPSGDVEIILQGSKSDCESLIQTMINHQDVYRIDSYKMEEIKLDKNFDSFEISY